MRCSAANFLKFSSSSRVLTRSPSNALLRCTVTRQLQSTISRLTQGVPVRFFSSATVIFPNRTLGACALHLPSLLRRAQLQWVAKELCVDTCCDETRSEATGPPPRHGRCAARDVTRWSRGMRRRGDVQRCLQRATPCRNAWAPAALSLRGARRCVPALRRAIKRNEDTAADARCPCSQAYVALRGLRCVGHARFCARPRRQRVALE